MKFTFRNYKLFCYDFNLKADRYKIGVFREESEYTYLYFIISLSTDLIHISLNLQCLVAIFYHGGTMGDEDDGLIMR